VFVAVKAKGIDDDFTDHIQDLLHVFTLNPTGILVEMHIQQPSPILFAM
jgi:hypothetical protein